MREAGPFGRVVNPVPQVDGPTVVLAGFGRGPDRTGRRGGLDRGPQGLRELGRVGVETGDLTEPLWAVFPQGPGGPGEQLGALAGEQLLEEDLPHQLVTEPEPGLLLDQEALPAQGVDGTAIPSGVEPGRGPQYRGVDGRGHRRRRLEAGHGVGFQALAAGQDDVADPGGEPLAVADSQ